MESKTLNLLPVFLVLMVLAIGVVIVFVQQPKLTGLAVLSEYTTETACVAAEYSWQNITNESCSSETFNVIETGEINPSGYTLIGDEDATNFVILEALNVENASSILISDDDYNLDSSTGIVTNATELIYSSVEFNYTYDVGICEDIVVGGECIGDVCDSGHLSLCLTSGECENEGGYWYNDQCNSNEEPSCSNDLDLCEDETSCENEGGYWYNDQCNSNEEDEENNEEETTITIPESEPVITNDIIEICTPNWQCSDWSECVNETQTRTCEDVNNCGTEDGRPALLQSCTLPETCFDEIKNQDEIGVDCGGVCEQKCGIFTIMGSVITGPIESGKEFFLENKLRGFLILGGMVVLIGGGVAIGILSKKGKIKINLKKFIKKNIQNSSQGSTNV